MCLLCGKPGSKRRPSRCDECISIQRKKEYAADPERFRKRTKAWKEKNPEKSREYLRTWQRENKEKMDAQKERRAAVISAGTVTSEELWEIVKRADSKCEYCGKHVACYTLPKHAKGFDHVVPISRGGKHEKGNMVVCCLKCNERKSHSRTSPEGGPSPSLPD